MESPERNNWEQEKFKNPVIKERDDARKRASNLQRRVAEIHAARYERTLYRLMERSRDNPDLVNALNNFSRVLDGRSLHGAEDNPLTRTQVEQFADFFEKKQRS